MRAVLQRVSRAALKADGLDHAGIGKGLVLYIGIGPDDDDAAMNYILDKVFGLRVFEDDQEKMNLSVADVQGEVLFVSNFTLYGDARHGRRPGYSAGAPVEKARLLYEQFCSLAEKKAAALGIRVCFGVFQAHMEIDQVCDGPVTLLLDSDRLF